MAISVEECEVMIGLQEGQPQADKRLLLPFDVSASSACGG
jgi:hypothetical protein